MLHGTGFPSRRIQQKEDITLMARQAIVIPTDVLHLAVIPSLETLFTTFRSDLDRVHAHARSRQVQPRKKRFTLEQRELLQSFAQKTHHPDAAAKEHIGFKCNLLPSQVDNWFVAMRRQQRLVGQ
eukprot:TRINITY_DN1411_c0_g1_i2.p1 TRINITY_DN1411_c0_g1~~TRINITY_DN1411_c0_g1_i2.p1  ORF type:complete len:125 (-),score=6.86 TRINITY_DN1411_c0_g1_i2:58-432(-)